MEIGSCIWLRPCPLSKWRQRIGKITTTLTIPINLWHGIIRSYLPATTASSATRLLSSFAAMELPCPLKMHQEQILLQPEPLW